MPSSARRSVRLLLAAAAVAGAVALAGCTPSGPASTDGPGESGSTSAPNSTGGGPGPSDSTAPEAPSTPFEIACDELLTAEQVYAFNPNYGTAPDYEPTSPAVLAVVDAGGTACGWLNQTSGDLIDLSVASLDPASLESLKNETVSTSTMVPTYSGADEGYFSVANGVGTAVVFDRSYWIVIVSTFFAEPGDPSDLIASVMGALP